MTAGNNCTKYMYVNIHQKLTKLITFIVQDILLPSFRMHCTYETQSNGHFDIDIYVSLTNR